MARHKCFISYHHDDKEEVEEFIKAFCDKERVFIWRGAGVMEQGIIDSDDKDYVMRRIRELYLTDSTVTIVLIGKCTKSRRYVDWEIASTFRNDPNNKRSGLLAINLPSMGKNGALPPRLADNVDKDKLYARYYTYPKSAGQLEEWIEDAFQARSTRKDLIVNSRDLFINNRPCS